MKKTLFLLAIFLCLSGMKIVAQTVTTITVDNISDLKTALEDTNRSEPVRVKLSNSFDNSTSLTGTIQWSVNNGYDVILDGNNIELTTDGYYRHFNITRAGSSGNAILENIILSGQDTGGGINFNSPIQIKNSTLKNNMNGGHGGAISGSSDIDIENCTFYQNTCSASGYGGGALGFVWYSGTVNLSKSVFIENKGGTKGGAFSIHQGNGANVTIESCYFEKNSLIHPSAWADGGAINIYGNNQEHVLLYVNNCTFAYNEAHDDGGAMLLQNVGDNAVTEITNCTFFGNTADNYENSNNNPSTYESGGGAIQVAVKTNVLLKNNTIVGNSSSLPAGGIGVHSNGTNHPTLHFDNNIIIGNISTTGPHPFGNNIEAKASDRNTNLVLNGSANIGIDNESALNAEETLKNVLGTDTPELVINENDKIGKIGNPNEDDPLNGEFYRYIPTLVIIPNDTPASIGLANGTGNAIGISKDQQGFDRNATNPDIGAVEILWVRFDANGGYWTESDDYESTDSYYFTRDENDGKVEYYYAIIRNDGLNTVTAPTDPTPPLGFSGTLTWVIDNGNDDPWEFNDAVTENVKLKAIWSNAATTHKVTYMGAGSDIQNFPDPAEYNISEGVTFTVANPNPTRTNHTFLGWSATSTSPITAGTPTGSGGRYLADDTFTMPAADVLLTAQWQNNTPPDPEPETPVLQWSVSATTNNSFSFQDVDNDVTTNVQEGTPVYLQIRPIVDDKIRYDSWSIEYTAQPADYYYGMSPGSSTERYNFNAGEAHELKGEYIYTVSSLQLYNNGRLIGSYTYSRPTVRHTIVISEKSNPDPDPDPNPWPPVIPDPDPHPDPNPDAWIIVKPLAPLCKTENEIRIPFTLRYKDEPLKYAIAFTDAAKEAGFEDISKYNDLPEENYISIFLNKPVKEGTYYGYIVLRVKGSADIELYPFQIKVLDFMSIVEQPKDISNKCKGDGIVLSVEANGTNLKYQWYLNNKPIPGAISDTYEAILTNETRGRYHVEIDSDCGTAISDTAVVDLNTLNILFKWDDVMYVENTDNKYISFQWYKNGEAVTVHANSVYYTEAEGLSGKYFVRAYKTSDTYDESCIVEINSNNRSSLKIYPNIVKQYDHITIESTGPDNSYTGARINIFNMKGQKMITTRMIDNHIIVPMDLPFGTYVMQIVTTDGKIKTEKIIVT